MVHNNSNALTILANGYYLNCMIMRIKDELYMYLKPFLIIIIFPSDVRLFLFFIFGIMLMQCSHHVGLFILQTLISFIIFLSSQASGLCLRGCTCYYKYTYVDCEGRNFKHFSLVSSLPNTTRKIKFRKNNITQLQNQPTGIQNRFTEDIDLSYNYIQELTEDKLGKTFTDLWVLDLSHNKIRLISVDSFRYLCQLRVLDLSHNKLTVIDPGRFTHLKWMNFLILNNNDVHFINETSSWPKIYRILNLSNNELKYIPNLPAYAKSIGLQNNSVYCGCSLEVNKFITFLPKVDCVSIDYSQAEILLSSVKQSEVTLESYLKSPRCKQVEILDLTVDEVEGNFILTCMISSSYPPPVVSVHHNNTRIKSSQSSIRVNITEPGLYSCDINNYISSQRRELFISAVQFNTQIPTLKPTQIVKSNPGQHLSQFIIYLLVCIFVVCGSAFMLATYCWWKHSNRCIKDTTSIHSYIDVVPGSEVECQNVPLPTRTPMRQNSFPNGHYATIKDTDLSAGIYCEPMTDQEIYRKMMCVIKRRLRNRKERNLEKQIELAKVTTRRYVKGLDPEPHSREVTEKGKRKSPGSDNTVLLTYKKTELGTCVEQEQDNCAAPISAMSQTKETKYVTDCQGQVLTAVPSTSDVSTAILEEENKSLKVKNNEK